MRHTMVAFRRRAHGRPALAIGLMENTDPLPAPEVAGAGLLAPAPACGGGLHRPPHLVIRGRA